MARDADGLDVLLPVVARWFRATFGTPTPPQASGWPAIAAGQNTLIFAPTGSGKTLAAFLACLDHLWRIPRASRGVAHPLRLAAEGAEPGHLAQPRGPARRDPGDGRGGGGRRCRRSRSPSGAATRPAADRQRMVRKPPDILITTPESLHLMLTSRARETLRSRLSRDRRRDPRPLPQQAGRLPRPAAGAARGDQPGGVRPRSGSRPRSGRSTRWPATWAGCGRSTGRGPGTRFEPRPVTIVDTGQRKELDLEVLVPFDRAGPAAGRARSGRRSSSGSSTLIEEHRSTIVFANNRRIVERLTAHLNERAEAATAEPRPSCRWRGRITAA